MLTLRENMSISVSTTATEFRIQHFTYADKSRAFWSLSQIPGVETPDMHRFIRFYYQNLLFSSIVNLLTITIERVTEITYMYLFIVKKIK